MIGIEHMGFDFDYYLEEEALGSFSSNLDSPSGKVSNEAEAGNLLEVLQKRGYNQEQLDAIAYKNFYRVFRQYGNNRPFFLCL